MHIIFTILLFSIHLFGNTNNKHELDCRLLQSKDYERFYKTNTRNCFERKFNAPPLPQEESRPIKITIGKDATATKIEDGVTQRYITSYEPGEILNWHQLIGRRGQHNISLVLYYSCNDDQTYYGLATPDEGGLIFAGNVIQAAYFYDCKLK